MNKQDLIKHTEKEASEEREAVEKFPALSYCDSVLRGVFEGAKRLFSNLLSMLIVHTL